VEIVPVLEGVRKVVSSVSISLALDGYARPKEARGEVGHCLRGAKAVRHFSRYVPRQLRDHSHREQGAGEYRTDLLAASCQVKMLVFERQELDLPEPQSRALYVLTDLQDRIVARN